MYTHMYSHFAAVSRHGGELEHDHHDPKKLQLLGEAYVFIDALQKEIASTKLLAVANREYAQRLRTVNGKLQSVIGSLGNDKNILQETVQALRNQIAEMETKIAALGQALLNPAVVRVYSKAHTHLFAVKLWKNDDSKFAFEFPDHEAIGAPPSPTWLLQHAVGTACEVSARSIPPSLHSF